MVVRSILNIQRMLLILSLLSLAPPVLAASLKASVERLTIAENDTFTLSLRYEGESNATPSFDKLIQDFDILGNNKRSEVRMINGRVSSAEEWELQLAPLRTGQLLIPSFEIDGTFSNAIQIDVKPAAQLRGHKGAAEKNFFVETLMDKEEIYVQEQLIVTHRIYYTDSVGSAESTEFRIDNALVQKLPETKFQRRVDGKLFFVQENHYAIFAQQSGEINIPAQRWNVRIRDGRRQTLFSQNYRQQRYASEAKTIKVKAKPVEFPANSIWLPASDFSIEQDWSLNPENLQAGEPVTREIRFVAQGLMADQLPALDFDQLSAQNPQIKYYADKPVLNDVIQDGYIGTRKESAAMVIADPGNYELSGISIPWWDTDDNQLKYAKLEPRSISIAGSAADISKQVPADSKTYDSNLYKEDISTGTSQLNEKIESLQKQIFFWQLLSAMMFLFISALSCFIAFSMRKTSKTVKTECAQPGIHSNLSNIKRAESRFKKESTEESLKELLTECRQYEHRKSQEDKNFRQTLQTSKAGKNIQVFNTYAESLLYGKLNNTELEQKIKQLNTENLFSNYSKLEKSSIDEDSSSNKHFAQLYPT